MLSDLDELVLTCADPRSKAYLREAVQCYKSGAYRASVVACWIAVAFDLVDKIKELAASGDKQAQAEVARFEKIQEIGDVKNALGFEKDLPIMAREKFEFISHLQYQDLKRLVEDRNRCAHPSMVSDSEIFEASAELARLHISNSVKSILSQPVAQGKAALERILVDMDSNYFPKKQKEVDAFLSNGPLKKPKTTLFVSFLKILVKTTFLPGETVQRISRSRTSLVTLKNMHPELWASFFSKIISDLIRDTTDNDSLVSSAIALITPKSLNSWDCLGVVEKMKMKHFVEAFPKTQLNHIDNFLDLPVDHDLYAAAAKRIKNAQLSELTTTDWDLFISNEVMSRVVDFYIRANSFAVANDIGKFIRTSLISVIDAEQHIFRIVEAAKENDQILHSVEFPAILKKFIAQNPKSVDLLDKKLNLLDLHIQGVNKV